MNKKNSYILWFEELGKEDVSEVGGKNASLGEMVKSLKKESINVPDGFATTSGTYKEFLDSNDIREKITRVLKELEKGEKSLEKAGKSIRSSFTGSSFPEKISEEIGKAYRKLCDKYGVSEVDVAVRSSATAEDLPDASFAGQQETFLNIRGEDDLLDACRRCFASLFTDRAISYRQEKNFDHMKVALSVGVQKNGALR